MGIADDLGGIVNDLGHGNCYSSLWDHGQAFVHIHLTIGDPGSEDPTPTKGDDATGTGSSGKGVDFEKMATTRDAHTGDAWFV